MKRLLTIGAALLTTLGLSAPAQAAFGVANFDGQTTADAGGAAFTQAGGHPYAVSTEINFNTHIKTITLAGFGNFDTLWPDEPLKDLITDVPPGLVGNPTVIPQCSLDLLASATPGPMCPAASQIGVAAVTRDDGITALSGVVFAPVFNMVPPAGVPARFGFTPEGTGVVVVLDAQLRSNSDYGLSVSVSKVSQGLAVLGAKLTLWGVPASPDHDPERSCPGQTTPVGPNGSGISCVTDSPRAAFLRLPTSCPSSSSTGAKWGLRADSWWHPADVKTASFFTHLAPGLPDDPVFPGLLPAGWGLQQGTTGCADVPFDPVLSAKPATPASPGASGYVFDLAVPQSDDPNLIGESDLRKAVVTLPEGVRVSPSGADGLGGCSPAQIGLKSLTDPTCPDASKIGSLEIKTPLLADPLEGSIYLATPHDNPSSSLLAVYLVAKGPGLIVKLAGGVAPNASTGQLAATFDNNPQLPFSNLHLEFFGGTRAPLTNPPRCGTYTTHAVLTGWSGKTVTSDSSFTTSHDGHGAPCPASRFKPTFSAGTTNPIAGKPSPLSVSIARSDDDEELGAIDSISMPDGLLARIASVKLCTGADARAGTCRAASRIGSVTAAAGPGPNPFAVTGTVYLGGKYKLAPFSLVFEVPVIAGPFDLGQITIRSAVNVDRHDATLKVVTDPLPTILQGIPLQVRLVNVSIDRQKFVINPTSCAVKQINAAIRSTEGTVAHVHDRFQVAECASLGLEPDFSITVGGKGHTSKGSSTALKTVLKMPAGGANLKSVDVSLPLSLTALLDVVNNACTQAQFESDHCEKARAGSATAITPLLAHGLRGGVFFVKDPTEPNGSLPNLIVALRGQVAFDLVGKIKIPHGTTLATKFTTVPDVPIKKFVLSLVSGSHSPLAAAENLCSAGARRKTASLVFTGQNGRVVRERQHLHVAGCGRRARG